MSYSTKQDSPHNNSRISDAQIDYPKKELRDQTNADSWEVSNCNNQLSPVQPSLEALRFRLGADLNALVKTIYSVGGNMFTYLPLLLLL